MLNSFFKVPKALKRFKVLHLRDIFCEACLQSKVVANKSVFMQLNPMYGGLLTRFTIYSVFNLFY